MKKLAFLLGTLLVALSLAACEKPQPPKPETSVIDPNLTVASAYDEVGGAQANAWSKDATAEIAAATELFRAIAANKIGESTQVENLLVAGSNGAAKAWSKDSTAKIQAAVDLARAEILASSGNYSGAASLISAAEAFRSSAYTKDASAQILVAINLARASLALLQGGDAEQFLTAADKAANDACWSKDCVAQVKSAVLRTRALNVANKGDLASADNMLSAAQALRAAAWSKDASAEIATAAVLLQAELSGSKVEVDGATVDQLYVQAQALEAAAWSKDSTAKIKAAVFLSRIAHMQSLPAGALGPSEFLLLQSSIDDN